MFRRSILVAFALSLLAGCQASKPPEAAARRYALKGVVISLDATAKTAKIKHEDIKGWMDAMTMDFPVPDEAEWKKLAAGDQIEGAVFVTDDGYRLAEIKVIGKAPAQ